jgi:hypothetical protein
VALDRLAQRDLAGQFAGVGPFLHCHSQREVEPGGELLTVSEQLDVPSGHLVTGGDTVGESHGDLLSHDLSFVWARDAASASPPAFLPSEGVFQVSVGSGHRVDLHGGGACSDLDHAAAFLPFARVHRTLRWCQLVGIFVRRICPRWLRIPASCLLGAVYGIAPTLSAILRGISGIALRKAENGRRVLSEGSRQN